MNTTNLFYPNSFAIAISLALITTPSQAMVYSYDHLQRLTGSQYNEKNTPDSTYPLTDATLVRSHAPRENEKNSPPYQGGAGGWLGLLAGHSCI